MASSSWQYCLSLSARTAGVHHHTWHWEVLQRKATDFDTYQCPSSFSCWCDKMPDKSHQGKERFTLTEFQVTWRHGRESRYHWRWQLGTLHPVKKRWWMLMCVIVSFTYRSRSQRREWNHLQWVSSHQTTYQGNPPQAHPEAHLPGELDTWH